MSRTKSNLNALLGDNPIANVLHRLDKSDDFVSQRHVAKLDDVFVGGSGSVEVAEGMVKINDTVVEGVDPRAAGNLAACERYH